MSTNNSTSSTAQPKNPVPSTQVTNGRLSSFGTPRDLTLGGLAGLRGGRGGAAKKIYAPNLNVTRNKNANVKTSKDTTRNNNRRGDAKPNRGRGGGKRENNLMQTSSIFSEGLAASTKRQSQSFSQRGDDTPLQRPTIHKTHTKIDLKAESLNIKTLLGDSDDDDYAEETFDKIDIKYKPVKFSKESDNLARNIDDVHLGETPSDQISREFFDTNEKKMFLIQFPDVLPCETDDGGSDRQNMANKSANESKTNEVKGGPNLSSALEEGQVGRLIRYKSGKCKLLLGKTHYNVNMGLQTGFLQELTSINTNTKERSGNIINLGLINSKMIVSPDWDFLFSSHNS